MKPRFGDMWIFEIYGSTEGNVQLANILNDESCICRLTPFMKTVLSAEIVKYDPIEEAVITNDKGFLLKLNIFQLLTLLLVLPSRPIGERQACLLARSDQIYHSMATTMIRRSPRRKYLRMCSKKVTNTSTRETC